MTKHDVIYLQDEGDPKLYAEIEITWCSDRVNDDDTKYVRADKLAECQQRLSGAEQQMEILSRMHVEIAEQKIAIEQQRDGLAILLHEWLNVPFFEHEEDWHEWVIEYRPRVETALASVQDIPMDRQEYLKRLHEQVTQDDVDIVK